MDIQVGMYVRLKEYGIQKVVNIGNQETMTILSLEDKTACYIKDVSETSYNLIDLIKIDDIVNNSRVTKTNEYRREVDTVDGLLEEKNIETILTREQYKNQSYKVKGE